MTPLAFHNKQNHYTLFYSLLFQEIYVVLTHVKTMEFVLQRDSKIMNVIVQEQTFMGKIVTHVSINGSNTQFLQKKKCSIQE